VGEENTDSSFGCCLLESFHSGTHGVEVKVEGDWYQTVFANDLRHIQNIDSRHYNFRPGWIVPGLEKHVPGTADSQSCKGPLIRMLCILSENKVESVVEVVVF
jgi:hypothetical protein